MTSLLSRLSQRRETERKRSGRRSSSSKRGVQFDAVQVREYQRRHGGSSTVPDVGYLPLGLDWRYEDAKAVSLEQYEQRRRLEGRVSSRSLDVVPMQERWRKLEKADARPALELQASARRSAQEIEAIRRSRNFHNRGCQCRAGACRIDACPCFARGDECFYKICSCFNCANRLVVSADATDATTTLDNDDDDDDPPISRRLSQAAADLPVRTSSLTPIGGASSPATLAVPSSTANGSPPKLRRRPTPARGMAPQSQVFDEVDREADHSDAAGSSDSPVAPAAAAKASKTRVKRRKDKSHKDDAAAAAADDKKEKKGARRHHKSKKATDK